MRRGTLLLALLALTPALTFGQEAVPVQTPSFKSGIELVTVAATVRDKKGRLVKGLSAGDFQVFDNGQQRAITDFRDDVSPVSLAILFDVSGSMRVSDRMTAARFAAHHVLSSLEPGRDEAALLTFDSRLQEVAPFTVDTRALQGALGEVDPFGATSLHDAIADASKRVAARTGRRRAVVVITDGIDTSSGLSPSQVSGMASAIDVPVYVIATVLPIDHPGRDGFLPKGGKDTVADPATSAGTIEDLAAWTGGAFFFASTPTDTSQAAKQVLDELRQHYVIAFEPSSSDGWRPLEIRTTGKDHVVRARSGYIAGSQVFH
ncbi:MAG TPA: VWA domain-containing protein [Vicinamibacterales bacterium]|nr:VWA domain-containing protein [Vicinamibacterales bacterium]